MSIIISYDLYVIYLDSHESIKQEIFRTIIWLISDLIDS